MATTAVMVLTTVMQAKQRRDQVAGEHVGRRDPRISRAPSYAA
jgi:hypothetical protein